MRRCEFHSEFTAKPHGEEMKKSWYKYIDVCGKPARAITPNGKFVCGMHRYHFDKMARRNKTKETTALKESK